MRPTGVLTIGLILAACATDAPVASPIPDEARVTTVDVEGRPSAVAVGAGRAWVTDDENHVVHVFDPDSLEPAGDPIDVPPNPIAIEAAGDASVWVGHAGGEVSQIDAEANEVVRSIDAGGSITGLAAHGPTLWASDHERGELIAIDTDAGVVDRRIPVSDGAVRVLSDGLAAWVSGRENTVTRIDPGSDRLRSFEVGEGPIGLAYDGMDVWSANSDDGTVTPTSPAGVEIEVGGGPVALEFTDDRTMWVANQDDSTLTIVRGGKQAGTVDLDLAPREMATDGVVLWVVGTNRSALARVDPA